MTAPLITEPSPDAGLPEREPPARRIRRPRIPAHRRLAEWSWRSPIARVAIALLACQAVLAAWVQSHGYWFLDDYVLLSFGAKYPPASPELLLAPWGGHFMPAAFLVAQAIARTGGLWYPLVAWTLVAGHVLINVLFLRLLVRHFGLRWRILVPLGFVVLSIPILQSASWWAAALNMLPALVCMVVAMDHLLSWLAARQVRDLTWTLIGLAVGLLFFEKMTLLAVALVGVAFALRAESRWRPAMRAFVRSDWPLLVGVAGILAAWLVVYRLNATSQFATAPAPELVADTAALGALGTGSASLAGGWDDWNTFALKGYSVAPAPGWLVALALQAVVILFVSTSLHSARAARLWLTVGCYALLESLALTSGRRWFLTVNVSLPRYFADLVILFCLALALATIRLRVDAGRQWEPRLPSGRTPRLVVVGVAIVSAQLIAANYTRTAIGLGEAIGISPSRPYVESVAAGLQALGPNHTILDLPVPREVLPLPPAPQDRYSWAFSAVRGGPRFAEATDELAVISPEGHVGPGVLRGPRSEADGPWCTSTQQRGFAVPMEVEIFPWGHVARIDYSSPADGSIGIRMAPGDVVTVPVSAGVRTIYVVLTGGGWTVSVDAREVPAGFCVNRITIGAPELADSTM